MKRTLILLGVLSFFSCQSTKQSSEIKRSGFLTNYEQLKPGGKD